MSQPSSREGRFHNKKAGIRAAVILIGLLHKSRKAKEREREREREESEGWVTFVPVVPSASGHESAAQGRVGGAATGKNFMVPLIWSLVPQ